MTTDPNTPIWADMNGNLVCKSHIGINPPTRKLSVKERFALIKSFGTTTLCESCHSIELTHGH